MILLGTNEYIIGPGIPLGSGGEANTASNLGGGLEVFALKLGVDLQFRTIVPDSMVFDTVQAATEIGFTLNDTGVTPGAYTNANITVDAHGRLTAAANGSPASGYVANNQSEGESSTNSESWQQKLKTTFAATAGILYRIDFYFEMSAAVQCDVDGQVTINDSTIISLSHFKNFSTTNQLWNDCTGGHYISNALDGSVDVDIDYKVGYHPAAESVYIRRARILVTRI